MQTSPPSVPIAAFFPDGRYPEGEIQTYRDECAPQPCACVCDLRSARAARPHRDFTRPPDAPAAAGSDAAPLRPACHVSNSYRTTDAECRERERLEADMYNDVRKAAEVHRAVRKHIKTVAVPGVKLIDMCETLENSVRALIEEKGLQVRRAARAWLPRIPPPFPHRAPFYRVTGLHSYSPLQHTSAQACPHEAPRCGACPARGWRTACLSHARLSCSCVRMRKPHIWPYAPSFLVLCALLLRPC